MPLCKHSWKVEKDSEGNKQRRVCTKCKCEHRIPRGAVVILAPYYQDDEYQKNLKERMSKMKFKKG